VTKEKEAGVWGITKNNRQTVHFFRNRRRLCPREHGSHGWLFVARPVWDPGLPGTCEICKDILQLEKIEEHAGKKKKVKV
jgi:hypothetical protein